MIICPKCERPVASLKQWHYCARVDIDSLFLKKEPIVAALFEQLILALDGWPGVAFSGTRRCIVFVSDKTFLIVQPMKKALDMHFFLPDVHDGFPVYKHIFYGGRHVHYARLHDAADLDATLMKLIRKSYEGW